SPRRMRRRALDGTVDLLDQGPRRARGSRKQARQHGGARYPGRVPHGRPAMNEKEERRGSGRVIVVALVVAVVGTLALIAYLDRNGGTESADGAPASRAAATAATATPPSGGGAAPVDGSVHDRAARDA